MIPEKFDEDHPKDSVEYKGFSRMDTYSLIISPDPFCQERKISTPLQDVPPHRKSDRQPFESPALSSFEIGDIKPSAAI